MIITQFKLFIDVKLCLALASVNGRINEMTSCLTDPYARTSLQY
jgi:hypothetical protein